jgi:sugar phosphate isomerase/epimerase
MRLAAVALPDPSRVTGAGLWETTAYDASFAVLQAAGYRWFELSRTRRLTRGTASVIRERAGDRGLAAAALHAPSLHGPHELERQFAIVEAASALGAPVLVFHVSSLRFAAADTTVRARTRAGDRERVRAVAEFAGERRIRVALENGSHPGHPDYLLDLLGSLDLPNVGIALDTGHANLRGTPAHDVAERVASLVIHTHLHDNRGIRDEHLPPGEGGIDWARLVGALTSRHYAGAWCLELKGHRSRMLEERLSESRVFMEGLLASSRR